MEHENRLTNEANIIASIRSTMIQLKTLAIQFRRNQLEQQEEYINDINAPSEVGRFTDLAQQQTDLVSDYNSVLSEIEVQLEAYNKFCEDNHLDYSEPWKILTADLKRYRSGISTMSYFAPMPRLRLAASAQSKNR